MADELSPHQAEELARRIVELYARAEYELLQRLATHLAKGLDADEHWTERQLLELQRFRQAATVILEKLSTDSQAVVAEIIGAAGNRGAALATLGQAVSGGIASTAVDPYAVTAIAAELDMKLSASRGRIYRSVDDIYRTVIAETTPLVNMGTMTRRDAAQRALTKLASNGVTGFIDRTGRRWEMSSYVEMASRQATKEAAIQGHTDRMIAQGHNLIIISDVPQECADCRPFEGKVLALKPDGQHRTLDDARDAGLYHPGCRHSQSRYQPGRTRSFGETADPEGDKARQKLRYLERQKRAALREEAAAMDDDARAKAKAKAKAYNAKIREHVATTSAKRQPHRERAGFTAAR
ncbi:phage minor capsid protein [Gordonia amicalis]|uniref:Phage minor capsid protein n=1 Tax=Gordonia amicalis TaxID=89053 RepID=A0ABU4DJK1_9ACTN|nr:phage minor capsid protein [Gordonia amicalis]MDV6309915.1 phage minor capsid protein [Gordonia amicalis]